MPTAQGCRLWGSAPNPAFPRLWIPSLCSTTTLSSLAAPSRTMLEHYPTGPRSPPTCHPKLFLLQPVFLSGSLTTVWLPEHPLHLPALSRPCPALQSSWGPLHACQSLTAHAQLQCLASIPSSWRHVRLANCKPSDLSSSCFLCHSSPCPCPISPSGS